MEHVVRVARSYDTQSPRAWCTVRKCGDHWHVVPRAKGPVVDPIELEGACDAMRALPPSEWDAAYAEAVEASEAVDAAEAARGARGRSLVPRGVGFWRVYYGAPLVSTDSLVAEHNAASQSWAPMKVIAPRAEQRAHAEYRRLVADTTHRAVSWLVRYLRRRGRAFDAALLASAFALLGRTDDAVLVARVGAPLRGALYPLHTLVDGQGRLTLQDKWKTRKMAASDLDHVRKNARVLVVAELDAPKLATLLAHEIAHAITLPVWQPENNHPPAFLELETLAGRALALTGAHRRAPSSFTASMSTPTSLE
jgi:hypothetical protein